MSHHLAAGLPDVACRSGGGYGIGEGAADVVAEEAGEAEHLPMRGRDAPQAVLMAKLEAALEVPLGGQHAAADIVGVPEATESSGLVLRGTTRPSESKALAVVPKTALDIAAREAEIAREKIKTCQHVR